MKIEWRTYADLVATCLANLDRVRALEPDVIVGVPRAGMVPATVLASMLGLPLADVWAFCDRRVSRAGDVRAKHRAQCTAKRVLLIDDASGYGRSMTAAMEEIARTRPDVTALPCAVYVDPESVPRFDLAMCPLAKPRLFEWQWWRSGKLAHCCVDIDGVLCPDPTSEDKASTASYVRFVRNAPMHVRPAKPVGAFVTGRSSFFHAETSQWLARHGVEYGALKMFNGSSPKSVEGHAKHKAAYYRKSDAVLFIESHDGQAQMIAEMARKDALCVTTGRMYRGRG